MSAGGAPLAAPGIREVVKVQLITSPGCHFCGHAREVLARVGREVPLAVTEIDLESPIGREALGRWRAPFPPIVILDGVLFGYGRISERKLRAALSAGEI